jgi:hypothetical protein
MYQSKGMSGMRLLTGLMAFFILTIIFTYFDPIIEDNIYTGFAGKQLDADSKAMNVVNKYLTGWKVWVPGFLLAIIIYALSAGGEREVRNF